MSAAPSVSVVVVVHAMREQAMRTLLSLSEAHQRGAEPGSWEVVVVENRSAECLDPAAVAALPGTFRYHLRDEAGVSPVAALNAGLALARASMVGVMIDGARLVTPGVIALVQQAARLDPASVVAVPGYQIGPAMQHLDPGHDAARDTALLAQAGWPQDGYGVFRVASMSWANQNGIVRAWIECNCVFLPRALLDAIGGADPRFDLPGGGAVNLWLWHRAVHLRRGPLVVLPGEGSFHQVHGGVTTSARADRDALMDRILGQLNDILGEPFAAPEAPATLLGPVPPEAAPFLQFSGERLVRFARRTRGPHLVDLAFDTPVGDARARRREAAPPPSPAS